MFVSLRPKKKQRRGAEEQSVPVWSKASQLTLRTALRSPICPDPWDPRREKRGERQTRVQISMGPRNPTASDSSPVHSFSGIWLLVYPNVF